MRGVMAMVTKTLTAIVRSTQCRWSFAVSKARLFYNYLRFSPSYAAGCAHKLRKSRKKLNKHGRTVLASVDKYCDVHRLRAHTIFQRHSWSPIACLRCGLRARCSADFSPSSRNCSGSTATEWRYAQDNFLCCSRISSNNGGWYLWNELRCDAWTTLEIRLSAGGGLTCSYLNPALSQV